MSKSEKLMEQAECAISDLAVEDTQVADDAITVMRKLLTELAQAQARVAELEQLLTNIGRDIAIVATSDCAEILIRQLGAAIKEKR